MSKNKMILVVGAGYLCTKLPNIKKVNIKNNLNISKVEHEYKDIMFFITKENKCNNIMIGRINNKSKSIKLININEKAQLGNKNIIESFNSNGEIEFINKINEKFNLSICQYVKIDYLALENLINDMGGIKIKLNKNDRNLLSINNTSEECILNGDESINYMKLSNIDGSTKKANRQKRILNSLIDQLTDKSPKEFIRIVSPTIKFIETTMNTKEIVSLAFSCIKIGSDNLDKLTIPSKKMFNQSELTDNLYKYDIENYRDEIKVFLSI